MTRYQLRTVSGQQYVWDGSPDEMQEMLAKADATGTAEYAFLICRGGTLVNLAHVEAFEPIEGQ